MFRSFNAVIEVSDVMGSHLFPFSWCKFEAAGKLGLGEGRPSAFSIAFASISFIIVVPL